MTPEGKTENSLAQRLREKRLLISDDVWQELEALSNSTVDELIAEVREFGRFPRRRKVVTPEDKKENYLAQRLREKRLLISEDVWQELEALSITVNPRHTAESAHLLDGNDAGAAGIPLPVGAQAREARPRRSSSIRSRSPRGREGCAPAPIKAFKELSEDKIASTKIACVKAREEP